MPSLASASTGPPRDTHPPNQQVRKTRPSSGTRFELQALEPRVLLSADLLLPGHEDAAPISSNQAAEEVALGEDEATQIGEKEFVIGYDPAAQIDDIFEGVCGEAVGANVAQPGPSVESAGDTPSVPEVGDKDVHSPAGGQAPAATTSAQEGGGAGQLADSNEEGGSGGDEPVSASTLGDVSGDLDDLSAGATSPLEDQAPAAESSAQTTLDPVATTASADQESEETTSAGAVGADVSNPLTAQLTDTLKSANGPPAESESDDSSLVNEPSSANPANDEDSEEALSVLENRP